MLDKSIEKFKRLYASYQIVVKLADEIILGGKHDQHTLLAYRKARVDLTTVKKETMGL